MTQEIFTAGHSNRSAQELVELLRQAGVTRVADVRRFPVSRRFPQHARARLAPALEEAGLEYGFFGEELGGRLEPKLALEDSRNGAWRDPSLRAFADALDTPELARGLERLTAWAREAPTAVLCAERDWHDCHRQILADVLVAGGWRVTHLVRPGESETHPLHPAARVESGRLSYPTLL